MTVIVNENLKEERKNYNDAKLTKQQKYKKKKSGEEDEGEREQKEI